MDAGQRRNLPTWGLEEEGERDLLAKYGVTDDASGRRNAEQAREYLLAVATSVIREGEFTMDHLIIAGMVARGRGSPCTRAPSTRSTRTTRTRRSHLSRHSPSRARPPCTLPIIRTRLLRLWNDRDGHGVPVGRLTSYADQSGRFGQFRRVYDQLSKYAHPSSISHFAAMRTDEGNHFTFQTSNPLQAR